MGNNEISELTRRDIAELASAGRFSWAGRLGDGPFLRKFFDLEKLPSHDSRFETAQDDIWRHAMSSQDWPSDWVFFDSRFDLLNCSDERFLRFLEESLDPAVRSSADEALGLAADLNQLLVHDGWELVESRRLSGRPLFESRRAGFIASNAIRTAQLIGTDLGSYVQKQVLRLNQALDCGDTELVIGCAKEFAETVCKTILDSRSIEYDSNVKFPRLVKLTIQALPVVRDAPGPLAVANQAILAITGNLAAIGHHLAELRNHFGTGHGKQAGHDVLEIHHARLAASCASALVDFLYALDRRSHQSEGALGNQPPTGRS